MIQLTPWIVLLLAIGGAVFAVLSFLGLCALYSHLTGKAVELKLGESGFIRIGSDDE